MENTSVQKRAEAAVREFVIWASTNNTQLQIKVPISRYSRSLLEMVRMGKVYESEGEIKDALCLYVRYSTIFIERLPNHPEYKSLSQADMSCFKGSLKTAMLRAEVLKKELIVKFAREIEEQDKKSEQLRIDREQEEKLAGLIASSMVLGVSNQNPLANQKIPSAPLDPGADERMNAGGIKKGFEYIGIGGHANGNTYPSAPAAPSTSSKSTPSSSSSGLGFSSSSLGATTSATSPASDLRKILLAHDLVSQFSKVVSPNTLNNRETCGILAGELKNNHFSITHVLIPEQTGTSDSCTALDELPFLTQLEKLDLLCLGWIHTHPSQTAFLSSVDMHNQYGYQALLPEALAIVVSHKFDEVKYLRLSATGLRAIGSCSQTGHHDHNSTSGPPVVESALNFTLDPSLHASIVDLRPKSSR